MILGIAYRLDVNEDDILGKVKFSRHFHLLSKLFS
jgi:hypothetical protein